MKITFLGATKTVTGSKILLSFHNKNILVDCGLFQGLKDLRKRNWKDLSIEPHKIDAVILTHAHIDHSGYIPLLVKKGFRGPIYASSATKDLCEILLPDSGYLFEEEARLANSHGTSKHKPALPLYTKEDAINSLKNFETVEFRKYKQLGYETFFSFMPAGHIIGASLIEIKHTDKTIIFTGDLGRPDDPIVKPPSIVQAVDYLIIESTYGDRLHEKNDAIDQLERIINTTFKHRGTVLIPSFAVGRAQHLLYLLYKLKQLNKIPNIPIYIDSPMTKAATFIFKKYSSLHRLEDKITDEVCALPIYVNSVEESKALDIDGSPKIIISASGMLDGGRVLHHLNKFALEPRNTIIFTGYQAAGTRGADIVGGKKQIKMFGNEIDIKAKIEVLSNMSAHADYNEMISWLKNFNRHPRKVYINHGEESSANKLKEKIENEFGWSCVVPDFLDSDDI